MKEILIKKLKDVPEREKRHDLTREFLQHLMLSILDRRGHSKHWAFVGGTALRVLYDLRRFSEDLDFSAIAENKKSLEIQKVAGTWVNDLAAWGFPIEISSLKTDGSVQSCFVQFSNLSAEFNIFQDARKKLSIKCEVDQKPPRGYTLETSVVQKDLFFTVHHHNLPSLFAGKLHAVLFRKFVKGRDLYDLLWYCTKNTPVNFTFLQNAALQSQKKNVFSEIPFHQLLHQKLMNIDFQKVKRDIAPFLEDPHELMMLDRKFLIDAAQKIVLNNL